MNQEYRNQHLDLFNVSCDRSVTKIEEIACQQEVESVRMLRVLAVGRGTDL